MSRKPEKTGVFGMVMRAKRPNWGGKRPGTGPKPETLSGAQVRKMLQTAKRFAKQYGQTIDEVLLTMVHAPEVHGEKVTVRDRLAAIKVFYERSTMQEGGEADQFPGPAVYLPEKKPDLAKVVDLREAKDGNESDD